MARRLSNARRRDLHPGRKRTQRPLPRPRAVLGCAVATVLLAAGVPPANADRLTWTDPAGDMTAFTESSNGLTTAPAPDHHAGDVTSAVLRHGPRAVTINLTFAELRRSQFNAVSGRLRAGDVTRHYFVQDAADARPRLYVFNERYVRACGEATVNVDYKADTLAIRVPRKCLKRPNWVKASAASENYPGSEPYTYYLDDAFSATPLDRQFRLTWTDRVQRR